MDMGTATVNRQGYRSLFWPIVLIAIGVIWLLSNAGVISRENLVVLLRLWPLLLIVIGLDLLFGRKSPAVSAVIGVGAVVLVIVLMLVGPSIGLTGPSLEVKLDTFNEPREDTTSASVRLDLSVATTTIVPVADSSDLFTAEVTHLGDLDFEVEGETAKQITLSEDDASVMDGTSFLAGLIRVDGEDLNWNIGLSPEIPLALEINSGVGQGNFDLSQMQLTDLSINGGVGQINLQLPSVDTPYNVDINNGAGELNLSIADDTAINLNVKGGVGSVTIDVPDNVAVRIEASSGIGNIDVPSGWQRLNEEQSGPSEDGVWQSSNFSEAARQIVIHYEGGVGNLIIQ
jgi:predicted membrane protein